jgi:hypothetical protein
MPRKNAITLSPQKIEWQSNPEQQGFHAVLLKIDTLLFIA